MTPELTLTALDPAELRELRETVRDAASESGYPESVRALEESQTGLDADLWRLLAEEIGLAGVGVPEEFGGLGGLAEIIAVAEELGATLAPVPFVSSSVLAGQVLAASGSEATAFLERLLGGEIAGPALTDARGLWNPDNLSVTLTGSTVSGSVRFVPFGAAASFFVVAAATADGPQVAIVEAADATVEAQPSLDFSRPSASVTFSDAPATVLTSGAAGLTALTHGVNLALIATGADALGGTQRCFDMTLEYIKIRAQFNREIGSFQAIKHRMADALMQVEMARSGLEKVTWSASDNLSADASVIKAWAADSYNAVAAEAIQLHGGIGFTWEHDAHLYFRRARYDAAFLGDAAIHRERVAQRLGW
jgi:alkylation response protein AidB-like acyl-CoA dehydrogenase